MNAFSDPHAKTACDDTNDLAQGDLSGFGARLFRCNNWLNTAEAKMGAITACCATTLNNAMTPSVTAINKKAR